MRRSRIAAGLVLVLCLSLSLSAEELGVDLSVDYFSKYIWRGQNVTDDPVIQPSVSLSYGNLSGGIWGNVDTTDVNGEEWEFTELDYWVDYSGSITEDLGYSVGVIHYYFPSSGQTTEVYAGLGLDMFLSPTLTVYYDVDDIEGSYIEFAVGHTIEKFHQFDGEAYCDLSFGASVGYGTSSYNDGYFGVNDGGFNDLTLSVSMPIYLAKGWAITPSVNYATMLDSDIRGATDKSDNFFAGIGLSKSF